MERISKWREGFLKSIGVAKAIQEHAAKNNIKLTDDELKSATRFYMGETKGITKSAIVGKLVKSYGETLKKLGAAGTKKLFKSLVPAVGVILAVKTGAEAFAAEDGTVAKAAEAVGRDIVFADLVETTVQEAADQTMNFVLNGKDWDEFVNGSRKSQSIWDEIKKDNKGLR
jgi:hypothetical protein